MRLKKLSILNFKNVQNSTFEFADGINCFVGDNGAGKTNIIDAIYYLSMCKSSLSSADNQIVRHGSDFFLLDGEYLSEENKISGVVASFQRFGTKFFKHNGKQYDKLLEHIGRYPVVMVSPFDTFLVHESADERRKYLNGVISQIDNQYLLAVVKYNKVLAERNSLLKTQHCNDEILEVLDMQLASCAEIIYEARKAFIAEISPQVEKYYAFLSDDKEQVSVEYISELMEDTMGNLLLRSRSKDLMCGHTSKGVHRDDMKMKMGEYPLKKYGSQGQQKSFLVALKLAQYGVISRFCGSKPLLLLDDLFDKLDINRVAKLLELTSGKDFGQIFISDCNKMRLESILKDRVKKYSLFNIPQGK
ncbi:MAG: DNA replication and repair protein RecF [Rikenellaceae bacterium]